MGASGVIHWSGLYLIDMVSYQLRSTSHCTFGGFSQPWPMMAHKYASIHPCPTPSIHTPPTCVQVHMCVRVPVLERRLAGSVAFRKRKEPPVISIECGRIARHYVRLPMPSSPRCMCSLFVSLSTQETRPTDFQPLPPPCQFQNPSWFAEEGKTNEEPTNHARGHARAHSCCMYGVCLCVCR